MSQPQRLITVFRHLLKRTVCLCFKVQFPFGDTFYYFVEFGCSDSILPVVVCSPGRLRGVMGVNGLCIKTAADCVCVQLKGLS